MADTIFVKAAPHMGERVALSEQHPDHPGGYAFVAGQDQAPQEVARTGMVAERLIPNMDLGGTLVQLEGEGLRAARTHADAAQEERDKQREALRAQMAGDIRQQVRAEEAARKANESAVEARAEAAAHVRDSQVNAELERIKGEMELLKQQLGATKGGDEEARAAQALAPHEGTRSEPAGDNGPADPRSARVSSQPNVTTSQATRK